MEQYEFRVMHVGGEDSDDISRKMGEMLTSYSAGGWEFVQAIPLNIWPEKKTTKLPMGPEMSLLSHLRVCRIQVILRRPAPAP